MFILADEEIISNCRNGVNIKVYLNSFGMQLLVAEIVIRTCL